MKANKKSIWVIKNVNDSSVQQNRSDRNIFATRAPSAGRLLQVRHDLRI